MNPDQRERTGPARVASSPWPVLSAPRRILTYFALLESIAVLATAAAVRSTTPSQEALLRAVLILGCAIGFEEATRGEGRAKFLLGNYLKSDMTSVWTFSAAVALPPAYGVACILCLLCYLWVREWRPAGGILHRKIGSGSTYVLASLLANRIERTTQHLAPSPGFVYGALGVLAAIVVYSAVNRGLVTCLFMLDGIRLRDLRGTWDDNMLELATLCLGGLVALIIPVQPALVILVVLPMVLLQRGAVVRQLEIAATTDSKTGLLNTLAWEQLAQRDLNRSQRESKPMSVLLIDLDRFKRVNDVHGHLIGDVVLKAVGAALIEELRGYDTVGRFGGEEFVASLPNADEIAALHVAERIRLRINSICVSDLITLADLDTDRRLAVSIGVACAPTDGSALTELLHAADMALYVAKHAGRNRVELASRAADGVTEIVAVDAPTEAIELTAGERGQDVDDVFRVDVGGVVALPPVDQERGDRAQPGQLGSPAQDRAQLADSVGDEPLLSAPRGTLGSGPVADGE